MAAPVAKAFYDALEAALKSPSNYPALTEATKKMLEEASKSEATKSELFEAINLIQSHPPEEKKVLISMLNALPIDISGGELQITQWGRQPIAEIISTLKEKCTAVFAKNTRKTPPSSTMSSRNAEILQQLATSKSSDNTASIKNTLLKNHSVAAVALAEQVTFEIKFKSNQSFNPKWLSKVSIRPIPRHFLKCKHSSMQLSIKPLLMTARWIMLSKETLAHLPKGRSL
jgi:hypothetical protein